MRKVNLTYFSVSKITSELDMKVKEHNRSVLYDSANGLADSENRFGIFLLGDEPDEYCFMSASAEDGFINEAYLTRAESERRAQSFLEEIGYTEIRKLTRIKVAGIPD